MKNRLIILFMLLCVGLTAQAQEPITPKIFPSEQVIKPYKVEVTFSKTVHILFPSAVKYIDLGSGDIIAGKADGAENVLRLKAAVRNFTEETNFSVITADGYFYSFIVTYNNEPTQLSIEMENWMHEKSKINRQFVQLNELGDETPPIISQIMQGIYQKNKRDVKNIGCAKYGMKTALKGIYINNDLFYFHTEMINGSNVAFDIDYIRFKIADKKVGKRTAMQETTIYPVRVLNEEIRVNGKSILRNVFVLPKITIPDNKVLKIEIFERNGGRHQTVTLKNSDLTNAKLFNELKQQ